MSLRTALRALAHRNFRLFFAGQTVSLVGTWMQQLAMGWVVFDRWHSARLLGVVGFCGQVPAFFLAPFAGVLLDRVNRHRAILVTQTAAMLQAFALAGLVLSDTVEGWHLVVLALVVGVINAFDMPARQAFLTEMVATKDDLGNAIALNSSMFNGARLVGPALAGFVLAAVGAGWCFLANGLSFLAVLAALLAMRVPPRPLPPRHGPLLHGLREGFAYAFGFPPIRTLLLLVALVSTAGMAFQVLMPVLATEGLGGDARTLGYLTAASGAGALAGAVFLAARHNVVGLGRWIAASPAAFAAALVALSFAGTLPAALPLLAAAGFAMMLHMASSNTVLQTIVDEDKRGRVMSLYTMAFMGAAPLGSLLGGALAEHFGVAVTFRAAAAVCLIGAVAFARGLPRLRAQVRPLYVRLGILPELDGRLPAEEPTLGPSAVSAASGDGDATGRLDPRERAPM